MSVRFVLTSEEKGCLLRGRRRGELAKEHGQRKEAAPDLIKLSNHKYG